VPPGRYKNAKQIFYEKSGKPGFLSFINEPLASNANSYFEIILTSLFPALYAWASAFNRHFLEMMPTVVLEGPPNTQKTTRAKKNLSFGSSNEMFFSGGSTVAGIQDVTAQYTQLELQWCVLGYGGAVTQTVSGGGRKSGAPLLLTMNPGASQRHEKLLTGRSIILKCQESPYQNHKRDSCKERFNPERMREQIKHGNTIAAEETFAWQSRLKKVLCSMKKTTFLFTLYRLLKARNWYVAMCHREGKKPVLPTLKNT